MDSNIMFPKEKPTRKDKSQWSQIMSTLTTDHKTLLQLLGEYISLPHAKLRWRYDEGTENLFYSNNANTAHDVDVPRTGERRMRSGSVYERERTVEGPTKGTVYATVSSHGDDRVKLHSRVCKYVEATSPDNFLDTLKSFTNQRIWDFMHVDGDGEWITEAILNGTLDIAHDGSYQPEITNDVCSMAVWVRCRVTKK